MAAGPTCQPIFFSSLSSLCLSLSSSPLLARGPRILSGGRRPALGYAAMAAWLAVLFYLLADTAAVYFCSSLEGLARLLGLPPAIAGATLLSLGNGAPDALSALASFAAGGGGGAAAVGLNGVLGEAMFVSAAVLGVVTLRVAGHGVAVDRASFFHDAGWGASGAAWGASGAAALAARPPLPRAVRARSGGAARGSASAPRASVAAPPPSQPRSSSAAWPLLRCAMASAPRVPRRRRPARAAAAAVQCARRRPHVRSSAPAARSEQGGVARDGGAGEAGGGAEREGAGAHPRHRWGTTLEPPPRAAAQAHPAPPRRLRAPTPAEALSIGGGRRGRTRPRLPLCR